MKWLNLLLVVATVGAIPAGADGVSVAPMELGVSLGAMRSGSLVDLDEPAKMLVGFRMKILTSSRKVTPASEVKSNSDLVTSAEPNTMPKPRKRLSAETRKTTQDLISAGADGSEVNPVIQSMAMPVLRRFASETSAAAKRSSHFVGRNEIGRVRLRLNTDSGGVAVVEVDPEERDTLQGLMVEAAQRMGALDVNRGKLRDMFGTEIELEIEATNP